MSSVMAQDRLYDMVLDDMVNGNIYEPNSMIKDLIYLLDPAAVQRFAQMYDYDYEYVQNQITDSKKWRVDDLVQDVNGDIFTIEGFKGDKLLVKDASETLWLTPTGELTWHSRPIVKGDNR